MIVFTIHNTASQQYYVAMTQGSIAQRWKQYQKAAAENIDEQLYREIRDQGAEQFELEEWAVAEDRDELMELLNEAIGEYGAISLQGIKTRVTSSIFADIAPIKRASGTVYGKSAEVAKSTKAAAALSKKTLSKTTAPSTKIATGRTGSAAKEKSIKEAIAREKAEREAEQQQRVAEQADEMKAIMARLDSRNVGGKARRA